MYAVYKNVLVHRLQGCTLSMGIVKEVQGLCTSTMIVLGSTGGWDCTSSMGEMCKIVLGVQTYDDL